MANRVRVVTFLRLCLKYLSISERKPEKIKDKYGNVLFTSLLQLVIKLLNPTIPIEIPTSVYNNFSPANLT